jgi:integrase
MDVVVKMFKNKGWKMPAEIGDTEPQEELTLVRGIEEYIRADPKNRAARKLCAWTVERGTLEINPCSMVPRLPETQRDTYISWEQFLRILDVADRLRPIIILLYYTGMRHSEVFDPYWKEVNFARRMIVPAARRTKEGKNPNRKILRAKRVPVRGRSTISSGP